LVSVQRLSLCGNMRLPHVRQMSPCVRKWSTLDKKRVTGSWGQLVNSEMSDFMSFMAVSFPHNEKKHNKDELVVT